MKRWGCWLAVAMCLATAMVFVSAGDTSVAVNERLARLRTLGKAFYENPTTQIEAVEQFRQALALDESSAVDRLNHGLALLRAGKSQEGVAELERVQKQDASIPHTWFNLGIEFKKQGETEKAIAQLERMATLVPDEPITHYNLGALYKLAGRQDEALKKFELAARLDPYFAAPHFQLFNAYRTSGKAEEAKRELARFQELRKRQEESGAGNEDVEWSAYSEVYEAIDAARSEDATPAPTLKFASTALPGKVDWASASLHVVDLMGDGSSDLIVASSAGVRVYRRGATEMAQPALALLKGALDVVPGDFDNDGQVDLCVLTPSGVRLFRNVKGVFAAHAAKLPAERFEAALWVDYDHDYDLDLLLAGARQTVLRNQGQAGFVERASDIPFEKGSAIAAVQTRVVPDTKSHDIVVAYRDRAGVLYKDRLGGHYEAQALDVLPAGATGLVAEDINNDSTPDLVWAGNPAGAAQNVRGQFTRLKWPVASTSVLADLEGRGLLDVVAATGVARALGAGRWDATRKAAGLAEGLRWAAADFNGDGLMDLAAVTKDGVVQRVTNQTAVKNNWLRVRLTGIKNLKLAPGAEVEVKAGLVYQKRVYTGVPLLFGLRKQREADTVRITWPNGLIQNEVHQKAEAAQNYQEAQRLSGSCPLIWTWNGRGFEYITDVLGVAPLGAMSGDGGYFPTDHDEYIWIKGESLRAREGKYEVRITEELSEVSYIDEVKLIAVDHPGDVDVFTNDKWKSPPFPEFRLFGAKRRVYPVKALEDGRNDARERLLKRDRRYADGFKRDLQGVAEMHALELDFGDAAKDNRAVLILHGWVDWADGSTFLAQAQASKRGLATPYLQVRDERGAWVTVIEDMGMPAGKPKTIAVDLTGKFIGARREVRIATNLCVFWDEVFLSEDASAPEVRLSPMASREAQLRFRGFAQTLIHPLRQQPEEFFYAKPAATSLWNPTPGMYTRYGDVAELLTSPDDRMAIMGSGDEMRLLFDASELPALKRGWKRDFLLKVDGWAKDRDANTAYSQTVDPLPFHGMSSYPYPAGERYPETPEHRAYRETYSTRPALQLLRPLHTAGTFRPREGTR